MSMAQGIQQTLIRLTQNTSEICKYCKKPVEFKTITIPFLGTRKVRVICECENRAFLEEKERHVQEERRRRIERKFAISSIGDRLLSATLENFERREGAEKALEICKRYLVKFDTLKEKSLFITGDPGNGKSHLAAAIAKSLQERGKTVVFQDTTELLRRIRKTFSRENKESEQEIMSSLLDCDLLIIDDLGAEKVTDWTAEVLFTIINGRYRKLLPTLITSNFRLSELRDRLGVHGMRICDRIFETNYLVENKASSYRIERGMELVDF